MDIDTFLHLKTLSAPAFQAEWRKLSPADRRAFQQFSKELQQESLRTQSKLQWGRGVGIDRVFQEAKQFLEQKYGPEFHVWVRSGAYFEIRHEEASWAVEHGLFDVAESRANSDMHCKQCSLSMIMSKIPVYNALGVHIAIVRQEGEGDLPPRSLDYKNDVYLAK